MAMMISKFNKIIHNKTVWLVFAVLISVAFVSVYTGQKSSNDKLRSQQKSEIAGKLYGEDVSRQEFSRAYTSVYVMYSMMIGRELNLNENVDQVLRKAAWQRLVTLKKAQKMNISCTENNIREMIQRQPLFQNPQTGGFSKQAYDAFVSGFLRQVGMSAKAFETLIAENVLINKASRQAALGATLVTDAEIIEAFHLYTDKLTVEYASLPRSLVASPEITEEEAKSYFEANIEEFRFPEKAIVHYVAFNVADYTNSVAVTDEMISSTYENNKQHFVKPETATNEVPEFRALDEVKGEIVKGLVLALAHQQAFNAADKMVANLSDETITFEQAAQAAGTEIVKNTPAFAATDLVFGVDPTAPFARAAFNLEQNATQYYSDPVAGRDTIYVISLQKKLESFLPAFEVVKADATEAAKIVAAEKAYLEKATTIHAEIQEAIQGGSSFSDAVAKYSLEVKTTAQFDASTPIEDEFGDKIRSATIQNDEGTLVDLIDTPDELLVAYIASKEIADEAVTLPAMRDELKDSIRSEKATLLVQSWQESLFEEANFEDLSEKTGNKS
ncbi:MAG TPA: peptidylprolyl isomerase [Pontiella sp.]